MRYALIGLAILGLGMSGCETASMVNVSAPSAEMQRVQAVMAEWPDVPADAPALKRPFFATIHIAGHRTTASGLLQFHNAHDFRITAATEMGVILFDGRVNWAGVTVLRTMPGINSGVIESLLKDLATAFQLPESLNGIQTKGHGASAELLLKRQGADTDYYTWIFDGSTGRLRETDVDRGFFDTLYIQYLRYDMRGWPEEMTVARKARLYTISFTFTDGAMAQR